jgi:hypothetical protein
MLQSICDMKRDIRSMAGDFDWLEWRRKISDSKKKARAGEVYKTMKSVWFFRQAKMIVDLVKPVIKLLRLVDSGAPCMGELYFELSAVQVRPYLNPCVLRHCHCH